MNISTNVSTFIYIGILLVGAYTSAIFIVKSVLEKQRIYNICAVFTSTFLLYSSFEFLLSYFARDPNTETIYHICISVSDVCYFIMVVSWLLLLGVLSGSPSLINKKVLIPVTAAYGILVEILVVIHWGLHEGTVVFGSLKINVLQVIITLNLLYSVVLILSGLRCLLFGITKMHGEKLQRLMIIFSLIFTAYSGWILYWDYSIVSWEESNILKFDPILLLFFLSCLISLALFFKKDNLVTGKNQNNPQDGSFDENRLWEMIGGKYQLTQREIEIMQLVYKGLSNPDIGKTLFIAEDTVKKHLNHIFRKTETKNRYELLSRITAESR